jgi:RNA polymerase sigma factor (sigma-70 family)
MRTDALVPGAISEEELSRLVDAYSGILLGLCRLTLGDASMAQDIVQETFLKAWKKGGFRQESEKAWLIRVAMNLCHDYHRSRWWRHIDHSAPADGIQIAEPDPADREILTLVKELPLFHQENVRLRFLGDLDALPKETKAVFQRGLDETSDHTGMTFALAVNYGSRAEIVRAAQLLAADAAMGNVSPLDIDEEMISSRLYTSGMPDPDLLVRTSGEMRLSNYLLWQLAYTEFYVTDLYWPDFSRWEFLRAIRSFQTRDRRFGGVVSK